MNKIIIQSMKMKMVNDEGWVLWHCLKNTILGTFFKEYIRTVKVCEMGLVGYSYLVRFTFHCNILVCLVDSIELCSPRSEMLACWPIIIVVPACIMLLASLIFMLYVWQNEQTNICNSDSLKEDRCLCSSHHWGNISWTATNLLAIEKKMKPETHHPSVLIQ